jgi:hypothetical protein
VCVVGGLVLRRTWWLTSGSFGGGLQGNALWRVGQLVAGKGKG